VALESSGKRVAQAHGFSLHAGVAAAAWERGKLERLCRYISRPAVSSERLTLTASGKVRYALKTPYRDGTTHVLFEPLDFLSRLAALVPSPRVNLTRFHGVFAPHHALRPQVVPSERAAQRAQVPGQRMRRAASLGWAQRLKRVFGIDVQRCEWCAGKLRIIACIEDEAVIEKILTHLNIASNRAEAQARAPPSLSLFEQEQSHSKQTAELKASVGQGRS